MLSYAFKVLQEAGYKNLASEDFQNAEDLLAAILIKGITALLKRGLGKAYVQETDCLSVPRGKIDITASVKTQAIRQQKLICGYDEFSVNGPMNRILKSTARLLLTADIDSTRKKELRKIVQLFGEVDDIELKNVNWNMRYDRNNQTYRMLMAICQLVCKGAIQSSTNGRIKMADFEEKNMPGLYEKFILEYYNKEHPELTAKSRKIPWQIDEGTDDLLPEMRTDVHLSDPSGRVLIIDAKYYQHPMCIYYDKQALFSAHLYQIFTYVKNEEERLSNQPHNVAGLLLYAKTEEDSVPSKQYQMSGNRICVGSLDLSADFEGIRSQLDEIANEYFPAGLDPDRS